MSTNGDYLAPPPRRWVDPQAQVPLSPVRPPFEHYHSSSTLPTTPRTPFPGGAPSGRSGSPRTDVGSSTHLQPYLTLPPRLLLVFLTPAVLPLILTIAHLFLNRSSTASLADSLRSSLLSACDGLAQGAASLQSMPRYLAMQTNQEVIRATQASILAVGVMLMDSTTIIETVVTFIVDTYRSMLLCTIELAVRGSLELLIGAVKTISDGITSTLNTLRTNIQNDISSANSVIQSAVDRINSVTSRVNININVPEFSIPSLDAMQNVTVPTTFEDSLIKLNTTLPTLSDLKQKLDDIISTPFELLKKEINETRIEIAASFNDSALPVPSLKQLSADGSSAIKQELCGDLDTSLIDDTANALHKLSTVAIGLMFLLLILIWAALCFWEWRQWRALKNTIDTVEEEWKRDDTRDAWRVVAIVEHPVLERYGRRVFDRFRMGKTAEVNTRWYLAYLAHPTCLALLLISLFGFLSIQFQLVALDAIKDHARENANSTVQASTQSLASKLNSYALQSSQEYADNFNTAILAHQDRINNELFGSWLNTTAVTLNSTLVEFYSDVENILNTTFGGTIIYGPINTFLYCILGSKITNLEKGLTWVSEHAHVTLPTLPANVLLLSNDSMNEMAQPIAAAAVGSGGDGSNEGVVGSLIEHFEQALTFERNFYAILLGIWLGFALIGLLVVRWNSGGRERYYAARGISPNDQRRGKGRLTPGLKWLPWNKDHPIFDKHAEKPNNVPQIVEPGQTQTSFFDYPKPAPGTQSTPRPFAARKGTFGSSISSLAAPGQAFLRLTSWRSTDDVQLPEAKTNLVQGSSEKYTANRQLDEKQGEEEESLPDAPTLWVNKWYRATERAKSFFPSRGQRHGQAMARAAERNELERNKDSDPSFGTRQPGREDAGPRWRMADSPTIGRALDGIGDDGGRYPMIHSRSLTNTSGSQDQNPFDNDTYIPPVPRLPSDNLRDTNEVYPRRMSRAPTVGEGGDLGPFNPFENPPPLPNKAKHDSVDYLEDIDDHEDDRRESYLPYTSQYSPDSRPGYDSYYQHDPYEGLGRREEVLSPASSRTSYLHNEAHVESVSKVQTGTAALASLFDSMKEKKAQGAGRGNPFSTPFDDNARGGRI